MQCDALTSHITPTSHVYAQVSTFLLCICICRWRDEPGCDAGRRRCSTKCPALVRLRLYVLWSSESLRILKTTDCVRGEERARGEAARLGVARTACNYFFHQRPGTSPKMTWAHANPCRFDLGTRDKADQALERLRDSLEEHLSVDTPDSMLSDRDTLHGTIRNHPVELSGDSASRPSPFLQEDLEAKNSCNPAVDSKKAARQPQLAEKSLAEAAEQRRQEGGADGEGEAGATVVDVESYNRAKEELLLAQNTVGSQVAEIESLNAQLEHMKGFLANMTVLG